MTKLDFDKGKLLKQCQEIVCEIDQKNVQIDALIKDIDKLREQQRNLLSTYYSSISNDLSIEDFCSELLGCLYEDGGSFYQIMLDDLDVNYESNAICGGYIWFVSFDKVITAPTKTS